MRARLCLSLSDPMDCSCQVSLSMRFSRQEYWSGLSFPLPGGLPDPGSEPTFFASPALADGLFTTGPPEKPARRLCCLVTSVVSDSVQPHELQCSRLLCPWDSPGKNTGVGCHFLLQIHHVNYIKLRIT